MLERYRKNHKSEIQPPRSGFDLQGDLYRTLNRFFQDPFAFRVVEELDGRFQPKVDVREDEANVYLTAELPGMKAEDIKVEVGEDYLTLTGEKKEETSGKDDGWYHTERSYGYFSRSFPFAMTLDKERSKATFKDGVLSLTVAKAPPTQQRTRTIPVTAA